MDPHQLPFLTAVALAGLLFLIGDTIVQRVPIFRRYHLPAPIVGGLAGAGAFLLLRPAGTPVTVPTSGPPVAFLVALLTTNMGLHITPGMARKALPLLPVFLGGAVALSFLQLAVVFPLAWLGDGRPLETAFLFGPLGFVGAPFGLNPPPLLEIVRELFTTPRIEGTAQGLQVLGVLLGGGVAAAVLGLRLLARAGGEPPRRSPRKRRPSDDVWHFSRRELALLALILSLTAAAFHIQDRLAATYPAFREGHLPIIVIAYLLGAVARLAISAVPGTSFPRQELTALLLGPTMGLVLTYAILGIPLEQLRHLDPPAILAALMAIAASAGVAWALMYPLFARRLHPYHAAVLATVFLAATTAFGPVAMAYVQRFTDEEGPINPVAAVLPLNAFYFFPWTVAAIGYLLLA